MLRLSNHFLASYLESSSDALLLRGLADLSLLEITDFFPERFIFLSRSFISSSSDESSSFTSFADVDRVLLSQNVIKMVILIVLYVCSTNIVNVNVYSHIQRIFIEELTIDRNDCNLSVAAKIRPRQGADGFMGLERYSG